MITLPQLKLRIIETSDKQIVEGLRMTLSTKLVLYSNKWHSIISLVDISKHVYVDEIGEKDYSKIETFTPIFRHWNKSIPCYRHV